VLSKHKHLNVTVVSKHMPGDYDIEYASPWAGANYWPVGKSGSILQKFEKATWPELERICRNIPEAGVHFQDSRIYGRKKDVGTATGLWFEELVKEDAWFKDVAPNVRLLSPVRAASTRSLTADSFVFSPKMSFQKTATRAPPSHQYASTQRSICRGYSANASRMV
jgi:hypothetical protein